MVREFYANLVGMREDNTVFIRGVWVPFGAQKINEVFKMKDLKHGSKFKKMMENPNNGKILNLLTAGRGKWEATKKDSHHSIRRGSLTEEAKVWFYFLSSVIVPKKHLSSVKEQEAMILYALLKGYKINIGSLIEESIKSYHASNKRGLIPHPATITRLCILAGVKGVWEEEGKCPRVSPLTLTGVTRGPKGKKQKEVVAAGTEAEQEVNEENQGREIEEVSDNTIQEMTEEEPARVSLIIHSFLEIQEQLPSQVEGSRGRKDNIEIMEMLRSMKREMKEREQKWERQQQIIEDFLESAARKKERMWEQNWKLREEEWKEEQ